MPAPVSSFRAAATVAVAAVGVLQTGLMTHARVPPMHSASTRERQSRRMPRLAIHLLAAPLSRAVHVRTGGFASPPFDGFALVNSTRQLDVARGETAHRIASSASLPRDDHRRATASHIVSVIRNDAFTERAFDQRFREKVRRDDERGIDDPLPATPLSCALALVDRRLCVPALRRVCPCEAWPSKQHRKCLCNCR